MYTFKLKAISLLLFIFTTTEAFPKFARVIDKDGYVNIRQNNSIDSTVVARVHTGKFVYADEEDIYKKWIFVHAENDVAGYVHKSRLAFIDSYRHTDTEVPMVSFNKNAGTVHFSSDDVQIHIQVSPFDYQKHKHLFTKMSIKDSFSNTQSLLSHYKGKPFYGSDGVPPQGLNQYQSIKINFGTKTISLPKQAYENLFHVFVELIDVYYVKAIDTLYITANSGDGAGSYQVVFEI